MASSRVAAEARHRLTLPIDLQRRADQSSISVAGVHDQEIRADPALVKAIGRGFTWFGDIATGRVETVTAIAQREGVTDRYVSQLIELALLSPKIVEQILSGGRSGRASTSKLVFDIELDPRWSVQAEQVFTRRTA